MKFAMILFWILMILWAIGGIYWNRAKAEIGVWGNWLLPWLCIALLGFTVTGNPFEK